MFYIFTTLADFEDDQSDQELRQRIASCGWTPGCSLAKNCLPSFSYPNLSIIISLICLVESNLVILVAVSQVQWFVQFKTRFNTYFRFSQYAYILQHMTAHYSYMRTSTHGSPLIENICSHTGELPCLHIFSTKTSLKV